MANVRCRSCGRTYRYAGDTCPNCGAYNRPPQREYVDADGTVRRVELADKVCYEEKECHEDAARGARRTARTGRNKSFTHRTGAVKGEKAAAKAEKGSAFHVVTEPQEKSGFTVHEAAGAETVRQTVSGAAASFRSRRSNKEAPKAAIILGIVIAILSAGFSTLSNMDFQIPFFGHKEEVVTEPGSYYTNVEVGETFQLGQWKIEVTRWAVAEGDPHAILVWIKQPEGVMLETYLYCWYYDPIAGYREEFCYAADSFPDGEELCYVFNVPWMEGYDATLNMTAQYKNAFYAAEVPLRMDEQ